MYNIDLYKIEIPRYTKFRIMDSVQVGNTAYPRISGQVSDTEVVSANGYRYRSGFWQHVLNQQHIKDAIRSKSMLGAIEHSASDEEYMSTPYDKAALVVWDVRLNGENPHAEFALPNNEPGNSIKALSDLGVPIGVSTRGMGEYGQDSKSQYVEPETYMLISWDFTRRPNFKELSMSKVSDSLMTNPLFKEMTQMYGVRDNLADTSMSKEKLVKEMSQLKDSLNRIIKIVEGSSLFQVK